MKLQYAIKRIFDFIASLVGLIIFSPLFLIIAIFIKIDSPGPVFFLQDRLGKDGKVFKIYKFRTMCDNAINMGRGLSVNEDTDFRITKVGKFLRKTSLDEIPQLVNIIKGEMSLIGPRPPVPYYPYKYNEYSNRQIKRFKVLPGITGLAQINGRNSISWDEKIEYDIEYYNNYNLILDLKIFILTIYKVIKKEDIYTKKETIK